MLEDGICKGGVGLIEWKGVSLWFRYVMEGDGECVDV